MRLNFSYRILMSTLFFKKKKSKSAVGLAVRPVVPLPSSEGTARSLLWGREKQGLGSLGLLTLFPKCKFATCERLARARCCAPLRVRGSMSRGVEPQRGAALSGRAGRPRGEAPRWGSQAGTSTLGDGANDIVINLKRTMKLTMNLKIAQVIFAQLNSQCGPCGIVRHGGHLTTRQN